VLQGRRPMAIKLFITVRSDWHLRKSCLEAFEGFFSGRVINTAAHSLIALEGAVGCPRFSPWFPLMRVFPVQTQLVDPVSSLLILSPLLSSLQLFLTNIGQRGLQPSSTVPLRSLLFVCACSSHTRPAFDTGSKVPT